LITALLYGLTLIFATFPTWPAKQPE